MEWTDGRNKRDWRSCLKAAEQVEISAIDTEKLKLRDRLDQLSRRRNKIQNRATVRAGKKETKTNGTA